MNRVLFTSSRPLNRAENIAAIYHGYSGDKEFMQMNGLRTNRLLRSYRYGLIVADEIPSEANAPVVLVGHGITGGKKCYLDQNPGYVKPNEYKFVRWAITTSEEMIDISSKQLGLDKKNVYSLGMPRTDYYFGKSKGDGGTFLKEKRAYLYAPTFRNKSETSGFELDLDYIDSMLSDDEIFVLKPHMLMKWLGKRQYNHIIEVSPMEMSRDYILDCDVVITDYSSIILDGYVAGKPGVLFEKNSGYLESRGMYLDYPYEYCSRYATNEKMLIDILRKTNSMGEVEKRCLQKTAENCLDGHSTERVCEFISQKLQAV